MGRRVRGNFGTGLYVPIVIQSRGANETVWISEVWRCDRAQALLTAQAKAQITGRTYRLLAERGVELDQVTSDQRTRGPAAQPTPTL